MRNYIYIHLTLLILSFSSCTDWLDVKPLSQVGQDEMFDSEEGFEEALTGTYMLLGDSKLYGDNLSMGFMGILAQDYEFQGGDEHSQIANFEYENVLPERYINDIWSSAYNAIANCNNILDNLQSKEEDYFEGDNYHFIKAEALALRAYLHFDILRLYNSPYKSNPDYKGIPYVKTFTKYVTAQSTSNEVLNEIISDLTEARSLLKDIDPILDDNKGSGLLMYRESKMNYYAIAALLARVHMYKNDKTNALLYAKEVIESGKFSFIDKNVVAATKDYTFYQEHIFNLYSMNVGEYAKSHFTAKSSNMLFLSTYNTRTGLYSTKDMRLTNWFRTENVSWRMRYFLKKYSRPENEAEESQYEKPVIPMIKIGEMYLIAAECLAETNIGEAAEYLKTLRFERGIPAFETQEASVLVEEILREYRRECFGEGQTFYQYKRLNKSNMIKYNSPSIPLEMDDSMYTLPLPQNEIQFGGRTK